jgi:TolB protein
MLFAWLTDSRRRSTSVHKRSRLTRLRASVAAVVALVALAVLGVGDGHAGPNRYGHSDRVERHLLPMVSTGPLDPTWHPDSRTIAFAMRGDIWTMAADGGRATALTAGPAYHFEPAFSPDGRRVALTMDIDGNLEIGLVDANGGGVRRVTNDAAVDVEPTWTPDGNALYYVSARGGSFNIWRRVLATDTDERVVRGIQPAVSPDGRQLAFVADVPGRLGSGGLWVMDLPDGTPRLVHDEETEYRARPTWTPDGRSLLFVSDERGSNDVMIVSASGGHPIRLTMDERDEYAPIASPDGTRVAFASNRAGPTALFTAPIGGGARDLWRAATVTTTRPRRATGLVRVRVLGPDGRAMPARVSVEASDGRAYAPAGGFHRVIAATETHYFHAAGVVTVEVPAGRTIIEAIRGFEFVPQRDTLDVPAGGVRTVTLRLARLLDLPSRGWYSGDTHVHDLHQGQQGLTHAQFFDQLRAEDLHVTNALVHMDGTRLMGRWSDLTGVPHPLSTPQYILQYGQEYRGSLGHISMLGVTRYMLPFTGGVRGTAYAQPALDAWYLDSARAQGGIGGFGHPYFSTVTDPATAASTLIPVDIALGHGDFYDVAALWSDEVASSDLYFRLLNCGFRIAATAGTDNFSDVGRDPPPGADRTYVKVRGPLSLASWMAGIRAQRTVASTGPLLELTVAGREPGDSIALSADAATSVPVRAVAHSIAPMSRLEVIVNGRVLHTVTAVDSLQLRFDAPVEVPAGGWIAARVIGPSSRFITDSYAFAQTSPVYVVRGSRRFVSATDAHFFMATIDAIRSRSERGPWRAPSERARFMAALDSAHAVYQRLADDTRRPR